MLKNSTSNDVKINDSHIKQENPYTCQDYFFRKLIIFNAALQKNIEFFKPKNQPTQQ